MNRLLELERKNKYIQPTRKDNKPQYEKNVILYLAGISEKTINRKKVVRRIINPDKWG